MLECDFLATMLHDLEFSEEVRHARVLVVRSEYWLVEESNLESVSFPKQMGKTCEEIILLCNSP
jgi:hypothetical protein